jgi:hypothetical protein
MPRQGAVTRTLHDNLSLIGEVIQAHQDPETFALEERVRTLGNHCDRWRQLPAST